MIASAWRALLAAGPVRLWAMIGAGPPLTLGACGLVWIIWKGGWPASMAGKQLDFLGFALLAVLGIIAVIIVTLAAVKVKGSGPGGLSLEIDADDAPTVVTTTVETKP